MLVVCWDKEAQTPTRVELNGWHRCARALKLGPGIWSSKARPALENGPVRITVTQSLFDRYSNKLY
jgi:hypothetical protein